MSGLELPPLGPEDAIRRRRLRFALAAAGTLAFVGAAIAVPLALAGREEDPARVARRHHASVPSERREAEAEPPVLVTLGGDAAAAPSPAGPPPSPEPGAPDAGRAVSAPSEDAAEPEAPALPSIDEASDDPRFFVRRGTLGPSGTLSGLLKRHGLGAAAAQELADAFTGKFDVRRARPEDSYVLRIERSPPAPAARLDTFSYRVSALEIYDVRRLPNGSLSCRRRTIPVQRVRIAKGARVRSSLFEAASSVGLGAAIVGTIAEVLGNEVDFFAHQRPGDTFRIIVDEERVEGRFQRYGPIRAIEYVGEKAGRHRAYHFSQGGIDGYFASTGRSVEREYLRSPLKFVRVTSEFGRRFHPVLHRFQGHMGVDLGAPTGTPVYASRDGTIIGRGEMGAAGNTVEIQHADGIVTIYGHLSRFEPGQAVGTRVRQKQVIGYVGQTGRATGPHLHYGMKKNGRFVDPMNFEVRAGRPVPAGLMPSFRAVVARFDRDLDAIRLPGSP